MKAQQLFVLAALFTLGAALLATPAEAVRLNKKQQQVIDLSTWLEEHEEADKAKFGSADEREQEATEDDANEERMLEAEERRRAVARALSDSENDAHAADQDAGDDNDASEEEDAKAASTTDSAGNEDGMLAASLEAIPRPQEDERDNGRARAQAQTQSEENEPAAGEANTVAKQDGHTQHATASKEAGGEGTVDHPDKLPSVSGGGILIMPTLQIGGSAASPPSHITLSGGAAEAVLSDSHNPFNPNHPFNPQNTASIYTSTIGREEVNQPFGEAPKSGSHGSHSSHESGSAHHQASGHQEAAGSSATESTQSAPAF